MCTNTKPIFSFKSFFIIIWRSAAKILHIVQNLVTNFAAWCEQLQH